MKYDGMSNIKIGVIADRGHLEKKLVEFLNYARSKAEVSIYLEETLVFDPEAFQSDEDVFLVKGKGDLILNLVKYLEETRSVPIINSFKGNFFAINRFLNSVYLQKVGISVPEFSLIPVDAPAPFREYIIKNIIDKRIYSFNPRIEEKNGNMQVIDERAWKEAYGDEENYRYFFYQKFIKSQWEYKVYGIGEELFFYKQIPILINPNKMESREKINKISELSETSYKAMEALDLKLTSIDYLRDEEGNFYLTDINCTPNFNYIKRGPQMVVDYLIEQARN